ncbi:ATPase [Sorangium cellulosum]|uniref:histidine kinase n=1 Tax=Sorangium cellulosum TaxID=56 RepID=A0A4P2Q5Q7_SORCE|nr:HAMP domain-containing sensor histidine kinase [Sorangium cellulosum]AUX24730.1 ATPase [Sorangium cellulosum]
MSACLSAALDQLVLERLHDGRFVVREAPPPWFLRLGIEPPWRDRPLQIDRALPFLEVFLPEAERAWSTEGARRVQSDCWTQMTEDDEELHLEATALRVGSSPLLVITRNDALFHERRRVLQRARELRLVHETLSREVERKDVLVHCIVHDLSGPLNSVLGALSLLGERPLPEKSAALVGVALKAALRQRELIREILDTFTAERAALDASYDDVPETASLSDTLALAIESLVPVACSRGVHLEGPPEIGGRRPCEVIAEEGRLARVMSNLIENALRFAPPRTSVRVLVQGEPGWARVLVQDEGPGVAPSIVPHLFQKFVRGRDPGAGSGLGLYGARIAVERWGGAIGYEARPEGGASFWIRLRRADAAQPVGGAGAEGQERRE